MAQSLYDVDVNSLRYLSDLHIARISNSYLTFLDYYIGGKPDTSDMLQALILKEMACKADLNECEMCFMNAKLSQEKGYELRL